MIERMLILAELLAFATVIFMFLWGAIGFLHAAVRWVGAA
jgi:hypothetical protein